MVKTEIYQISASLVRNIGGNLGRRIRRSFYRLAGAKIGKGAKIHENVTIYRPYNLEVGEYCGIGKNTVISSCEKIKLGKEVYISPNCCIYDNSHKMPKIQGKDVLITAPIEIGEGSWVGANSTILKGVKIGKYSTIGAGSVVMRNIPDNVIAIGNPARIIKRL